MEVDFTGKVVLVTGASAGIGEVIAIYFAKHGAKLSLVGRNEKNLKDVAYTCEKEKGVKPLTIIADLAETGACEKVAKETLDHFGKLDILINNAGLGVNGTIQDTDMEKYDFVFKVNLRAVYNLTRLLVPALIESKGNIVNISSALGSITHVGFGPYSMTKAAVNHFTRLTALELAPKGVRVNTVSPGATISKFLERVTGLSPEQSMKQMKEYAKIIPMGEACTGEDIAKMVLHVASDNCRLVTGTNIFVDGGITLTSF